MTTISFGDEVDFVALISYLQRNDRAIASAVECKATILCILGAFLFIDDTLHSGLVGLVSVVEEMHYNRTFKPLVVAKTILSVDQLHHHQD